MIPHPTAFVLNPLGGTWDRHAVDMWRSFVLGAQDELRHDLIGRMDGFDSMGSDG